MTARLRGVARAHPNLTAAVAILAVVIAFFWPVVAQGRDFSTIAGHQAGVYPWAPTADDAGPAAIQSDQAALSYPWQAELNRRVDEGTLPLWQRSNFLGGYPMFSNGNAAHLYPPRLVPALLGWSAQSAHHLASALHLFGSGFFCFLFLRELRRSWWASVFGGVAWMLSSYNMAWLHFEVVAPLQALLPAALVCVVRAHRRRTAASTVAAGAALGLMMISGHVLWMGISAMVAGGYAVALAVERRLEDPGPHRLRAWIAAAARPLAIAAVAAGAAAVVLVPTARTLADAHRQAFDYEDIYATTFTLGGRQLSPPTVLYRWFVPWSETLTPGTINTHMAFAGTITAVFAVVGAFRRRVRGVGFARTVTVFFTLAAIGGPVTWLAYHAVPVFRVFRPYGRFFQWATLGVVVLAAIGFDHVRAAYSRRVAGRPLPPVLRPVGMCALVVVVTVAQLLVVGRGLNPTFPADEAALRYPRTGLIDALVERRDHDPWPARGLPVSDPASGVIMFSAGNHNQVFDLDLVGGYDSVLPARNHRMLRYLSGADDETHSTAAFFVLFLRDEARYDLLARLGIGAVVAPPDLDVDGSWGGDTRTELDLTERYSGVDGTLFVLDDDVGPHVVGRVEDAVDADDAFETFVDPDFDWEHGVVLEPDARRELDEAGVPVASRADGDVAVTGWGSNTLEVTVDASAPGLLVIPATWDAGWSATVDGESVPVVRGNYYQQVVPVGAGRSVVELRYRPDGIVLGGGITAATVAVSGGAIVLDRVRRRKGRRARRTDGLEHELVSEQRRPGVDGEAFESGETAAPQAVVDVAERHADGGLGPDLEATGPDQSPQRAP